MDWQRYDHWRIFDFQPRNIIAKQNHRRKQSHPETFSPLPQFNIGDLVFSNSEGNKLKARDKLIVREKLDNGIYQLDRVHQNSGTKPIEHQFIIQCF